MLMCDVKVDKIKIKMKLCIILVQEPLGWIEYPSDVMQAERAIPKGKC